MYEMTDVVREHGVRQDRAEPLLPADVRRIAVQGTIPADAGGSLLR